MAVGVVSFDDHHGVRPLGRRRVHNTPWHRFDSTGCQVVECQRVHQKTVKGTPLHFLAYILMIIRAKVNIIKKSKKQKIKAGLRLDFLTCFLDFLIS
jgi:hypothetical protein